MKKLIKETNFLMENAEADDFASKMYKLEAQLEKKGGQAWNNYEAESGDFWHELGVEGWSAAFVKDAMGCMAYEEKLKMLIENKTMNKLELKEASRQKLFNALKNTNTVINSNELTGNVSLHKMSKFGLINEGVAEDTINENINEKDFRTFIEVAEKMITVLSEHSDILKSDVVEYLCNELNNI